MDENDFMTSILEDMSDAELEVYCEALMQDTDTSKGKETNNE